MILSADPKSGYLVDQREIDDAIARVLGSGQYILGPEVAAFEREWAEYLGVAAATGVGNGTDAIELALRSLGIGAGDTVITVSHTAVATVTAIELAEATPLLIDVDENSMTLSPRALADALRQKKKQSIRAVIPVHLYGQPAEMTEIMKLAAQHQLHVIEDCAQAHGAMIGQQKVGTFGEVAAFSFYPTKNLAALGDGGAVVTKDHSLGARLRELRAYGWRERYISERAGMNTRLDEVQAAILRIRLRRLDQENARRSDIARQYCDSLGDLPLRLPPPVAHGRHVYHQFTIRLSNRDGLRRFLAEKEIQTAVLYPQPVHEQPAYCNRVHLADSLAVTEKIARELLCLPIHPWLKDAEISAVAKAIREWFDE